MNITFATTENMTTFWGFVRTLLGFASPWVMIAVAIMGVGLLLGIVINSFKKASKDADHEDDIEIKHY